LLLGDVISGNIAFNGFYELALSRHMVKLAQKGSMLVDVGANMGYFSLLWAGANSDGNVVAFEAAPRNIKIIENNLSQNRLSGRITLVPKAAGRQSGAMAFDVGPVDQTGWGGIACVDSSSTIKVPVVRLDQELPDAPIDVLKIDVEGAESLVLLGASKTIETDHPAMVIEVHHFDHSQPDTSPVIDQLQGWGYQVKWLSRWAQTSHLLAI